MLSVILIIVGFILLIKGADYLVNGSSSLASKYGIPQIVIGLTIVAFGTSAPELIVNIIGSIRGNTGIVIGNILGSNIANILLILGVTSLIYPLSIKKNTIFKELPFSILAMVLLGIMFNDHIIGIQEAQISRFDASILLVFFALFMIYIFSLVRKKSDLPEEIVINKMPLWKQLVFIIGGLAGLTLGGHLVVTYGTKLALTFGVSERVIGLTIVAIGTSLPELVTSATAAFKKHSDIAIGNVVGSNIFNVLWILGVSGLISPLPAYEHINTDLFITLLASGVLFAFVFMGKKFVLQRHQGLFLILFYIGYIISLFL